jgi:glycerol-3-phosphate dehydrogenase
MAARKWWVPANLMASSEKKENFMLKCEDGTSILPWLPPSRNEQKQRLKTESFDILVIGGGATGSGVAMDAASRGLKTAMVSFSHSLSSAAKSALESPNLYSRIFLQVEQDDFAAGTSSRSTKLIHGGIRYLALAFQSKIPPQKITDLLMHLHYDHSMMQVVMHDLYERAYMIQSAPFMTQPLPMMIPLHKWWEIPVYWVSGKMYDWIAGAPSSPTIPARSRAHVGRLVSASSTHHCIAQNRSGDSRARLLLDVAAARRPPRGV